MTSPVLHTDVYTDFKGLAELRGRAGDNSEETLREVAGQFEALFIQMMLKSMRDAGLGEGLMDSDQTKTYQSMYDQQLALDMSKKQGLGLAEMMVQQLRRADVEAEAGEDAAEEATAAAPLVFDPQQRVTREQRMPLPASIDTSPVARQSATAPRDWRPGSQEDFVRELWPHAQRAADELGTRPEALIAQAALETGWGKHMVRGADGQNSFNLFGIKADARWQGERAVTETVEFRDGLMRRERATFRAYPSLADSFADYTDFLKSNPRYAQALNTGSSGPDFVRALSQAGYATDPDYPGKINRIMDSEVFRDTTSGIKEAAREPLS